MFFLLKKKNSKLPASFIKQYKFNNIGEAAKASRKEETKHEIQRGGGGERGEED